MTVAMNDTMKTVRVDLLKAEVDDLVSRILVDDFDVVFGHHDLQQGDVEKTEIDGLLILRELNIGDVEARIRQAGEGLFLRIVVEETFIRAARVCAAVPPPG